MEPSLRDRDWLLVDPDARPELGDVVAAQDRREGLPLIVKPSRSDASIGIGKKSLVHTWEDLTRRVQEIRKELQDYAL